MGGHCSQQGAQLNAVEWDCANSANPIRLGLWRAIRRLVCNKCQPRPMSMSFMHLDDFMTQALAPCSCLSRSGLDGLIVASLRHLCTDQNKANQMILRLAEAGKHVLAEDGVCRSCCHASTKALIQKKRLLIAS